MFRICLLLMCATVTVPVDAAQCTCGPSCPCGEECDCGPDCKCTTLTAATAEPDLPAELQSSPSQPLSSDSWAVEDNTRRINALMEWTRKTSEYLRADRADEERRIEKVVKRVLGELNITVQGPGGAARKQTVQVGGNWQGGFAVQPGEKLVGYTDPVTGQYVQFPDPYESRTSSGLPVQVYDAPFMQVRTSGQRAGLRVRARPMMNWMSGGSCVGGQCR